MEVLGHRHHLRGEVNPKDRDALLTKIPGNMPRPAAEIGDETAATSLFRKPIQEMPVERFTRELVREVFGVRRRRRVVAFANVHRSPVA